MKLPVISPPTLLLLCTALLGGGEPSVRVYQVPSGIVTYTIQNDGPMIQKRGQKRRIFDRYGYRELVEEATVQSMNIMGETQQEETHTKTLRVGTQVTQADLIKKRTVQGPAAGLNLFAGANGGDLTRTGEKMLQSMGAKKKGQKRIVGVLCDVWELPGITQCLYKGVPLEIITQMPNLRQIERATEARFNLPIAEANFQLPDFPVERVQMPPELARALGAEPPGEKTPPSSQNKDERIPPQLKAQLQTQYGIMKEGYMCFEKARRLPEAQACSDRLSAGMGDAPEKLSEWNPETKAQLLNVFKIMMRQMECAKGASTFRELDHCQEP